MLSNSVVGEVRTVVVSRGLVGLTKNHYSFNPYADETCYWLAGNEGIRALYIYIYVYIYIYPSRDYTGYLIPPALLTSSKETIHFITAVGQSQAFAYHRAHGPTQVALTSEGSSSCICDKGLTGRLCETGGVNCAEFEKDSHCCTMSSVFWKSGFWNSGVY